VGLAQARPNNPLSQIMHPWPGHTLKPQPLTCTVTDTSFMKQLQGSSTHYSAVAFAQEVGKKHWCVDSAPGVAIHTGRL
jgi:hypothetical protein